MDGIQLDGSGIQSKDYSVDAPEDVCTPTHMADLKVKYSAGVNSTVQKKELYMKLDEILIEALRKEFEVVPGHSIDRLDMVKFLTEVVHHHMGECPDLEKVLTLRDTVLTGRIKRAFPEVEYKRKQLRQDHYRKAWLYVNLRRKPSSVTGCCQDTSRETMISSSTWTSPALPGSAPPSQTSSSPSSPTSREESPSPGSYVNTLFEQDNGVPVVIDDGATIHYHGALQDTRVSNGEASIFAKFSGTHLPEEKTALVLDNLSIQKWVVSNYVEDGSSFVPVQDVVRAFKEEYHYDISYKDCHQMIYSAFTGPRNRSSPMRTVRVTSLGQQYVYRGIAPRKKVLAEDSSQSDDDQTASKSEDWKHVLEEAREERDLALLERNQAHAALMELEKEHAQALRTIEKLKKDRVSRNASESSRNETPSQDRDLPSDHEESSSLDKLLRRFGDVERANVFAGKHQETDYVKERKDAIWRDIVVQTQEELDALLKRLEMVKKERNSYLERLHSLENDNQELRDAVSAPRSEATHRRLFADIAGFKSNCGADNGTKEALSSVLAHLRSKRKQAAPAKFSKVPKFDHASLTTENNFCQSKARSGLSPAAVLGATSPPGVPDDSNVALIGVRKRDCHVKNVSNDADHDCEENRHNLLVYAVGSGLVGFSPHPLED